MSAVNQGSETPKPVSYGEIGTAVATRKRLPIRPERASPGKRGSRLREAVMIGIAGGTGAGKSTLVRAVIGRFGGVCVGLDSYYRDRSAIKLEERSQINYDEPAAIDHTLLIEHLRRLRAGESIQKPRYSFHTHTRTGTETVPSARLILVDGLFTLWWEELRTLLDLRVFVDAPADLRLLRRVQRDVTERGRSVESVMTQYLQTVRPMHERYVEPTKLHADLVVTNGRLREECTKPIVAAVHELIGSTEFLKKAKRSSGPCSPVTEI